MLGRVVTDGFYENQCPINTDDQYNQDTVNSDILKEAVTKTDVC